MCKEVYPQQPSFKKSKFAKLCIVGTILCLIVMLTSFKGGHMLRGIIALLQVVLFASSWLMGMEILKEKKKFLHTLFAVIALVLIVPFVMCANNDKLEKLDWPTSGVAEKLPDPNTKYGKVHYNTEKAFSADLEKVDQSKYEKYVTKCQKKGFTEENEKSSDHYHAYDSEGYELYVSYYDYNHSISISLSAPIQMANFSWPSKGLATMLPKPASTYGKIETDSSDQFIVYIGKTSKNDYQSYVDKVSDASFNVDYTNADTSYHAENKDGYYVEITYKRQDTMYLYIRAPYEKDEPEEPAPAASSDTSSESKETPEETKPAEGTKEEKTDPSATDDSTGVDPDLKAFLDEYEEFMDKYIEFMQKYENSSNTAAMFADYTVMLAKYASFTEKLDRYDSDTMSAADSAYYLEVVTRVNQKLTAAALS